MYGHPAACPHIAGTRRAADRADQAITLQDQHGEMPVKPSRREHLSAPAPVGGNGEVPVAGVKMGGHTAGAD